MDNPFTMSEESEISKSTENVFQECNLSYSDIANKLLKDKLLLTALELHSELIETGREIPRLKEYFSNPGNFETQSVRQEFIPIPRSSSQVTLDSLDMTRFSEDGERGGVDERVAVLEFELRKAKETINALRARLTVATECETPTTDNGLGIKSLHCEPIKPHEQRALNFLLNEYLLMHGYKLTSITFADENEDQDFEDWDDVGLNIPKPAELLQLYRDAMRQGGYMTETKTEISTQTEELNNDYASGESKTLITENQELKDRIFQLETEKSELLAKIERLNEPVQPVTTHFSMSTTTVSSSSVTATAEHCGDEQTRLSTHSGTPEHFEIVPAGEETDGATERERERDDASSLNETEWLRVTDSETGSGVSALERLEPAGAEARGSPIDILNSASSLKRPLPVVFQKEVLAKCFVNTSKVTETPLLQDILLEGISQEKLVHILAVSLPRIIPNIVLNKRDEAVPLIISTIHLSPNPVEREGLIQLLFNLKKRPHEDERRIILTGMVGLARVTDAHVVEGELLPQCWEQMNHRYVERRLLVAEACSALAPYVSSALRNSLLLSMLQQLLVEDREETVRLSCAKSLTLVIALIADVDKYSQCEELVLIALQDNSANVVQATIQMLLPVLAKWAFDLQRLQSHLLTKILYLIKTYLQKEDKPNANESPLRNKPALDIRTSWIINAFRSLLPYLLMSVATVQDVTQRIDSSLPQAESRSGFADLCRSLTNPAVFYDGEYKVGAIMSAFDSAITTIEWPELTWVSETMVPELLNDLEHVRIDQEEILFSFISFFKALNAGFGRFFAKQKVKSLFMEKLQILESSLTSVGNEFPTCSIIPVFLLAVEAPYQVTNNAYLSILLELFITFVNYNVQNYYLLHSKIICFTGVVHPRHVVRHATANLFLYVIPNVGESITTNRIVPALITLASDPQLAVRTATIPVFGALIENSTNKEVLDKTYFQLQSFLSDPAARDDHATVLQLVTTLGRIVSNCDSWFREEVILPHLAAMAAYTMQLTNQTRRIDLGTTLVEAFSASVYCSLSKNTITTVLLPGLGYLENLCSQSLPSHHGSVLIMIQEAESRSDINKPIERSSSGMSLAQATSNVGQGVEDMKQKMTKIFQTPLSRPTNLPNLQSIFRKK
ncbi:RAB11-binding protein RELCH homolog [Nilaparvata lugens]|uniref:RAB11-binding protein RELCH homolog n=1 Tax=Nilaparvata lugens TaxID=108931 RepID=UPI00193DAE2B|nr:RAB11-binding protein RELCH homolog [Nilaparvata lugens]